MGLWLSALNVKYRDIKYIVPVTVQLWLLAASPVVYPATNLEEPSHFTASDPMAGAVESFRWVVIGGPAPSAALVALSTAVAIVFARGWDGRTPAHRAPVRGHYLSMPTPPVVIAEHLSKNYILGSGIHASGTLRDALSNGAERLRPPLAGSRQQHRERRYMHCATSRSRSARRGRQRQ